MKESERNSVDVPEEADQREVLALRLGAALHRYGIPAHRLEETTSLVLSRLGLEGSFFALPTSVQATFGKPELHKTSMIRADAGDVNLEKLALLDGLADDIIRGDTSIAEAQDRIVEIENEPVRYGIFADALGTGAGTAVAARIFGGGWREIVVAGLIGVVIGLIGPLFARHFRLKRVFEFVAAVLAAGIAVIAGYYYVEFSFFVATLAGLILLIPGFRLTTAMTELGSGHLVSGTARLTGAAMALLSLAFGSGIGNRLANWITPDYVAGSIHELPEQTLWIALLFFPISMMVLMRARPSDIGFLALATFVAFAGSRFGSIYFGPELGGFVGAFGLAIAANVISNRARRPASLMIAPGLILLVPGSLGFRGLTSMLEQDTTAGIQLGFQVGMVGIAIVTGLLVANALLPSRRGL